MILAATLCSRMIAGVIVSSGTADPPAHVREGPHLWPQTPATQVARCIHIDFEHVYNSLLAQIRLDYQITANVNRILTY